MGQEVAPSAPDEHEVLQERRYGAWATYIHMYIYIYIYPEVPTVPLNGTGHISVFRFTFF